MSWRACESVPHEWEAVRGWCGRYRCRACGVLGYRGVVVAPFVPSGVILEYKCPKCHGPTTAFRYKRPGEYRVKRGSQPCPACEPGRGGT